MKSFVLTILAFGIFATMAAEEPNLEQVLEQAEAEINQELLNRVMNGAQSRKFGPKKFTLASRALDARNTLFHKTKAILVGQGIDEDKAADLARLGLRQNRKGKKKKKKTGHASGGQDTYTRPVEMVDDMCEGEKPFCVEEYPFRTISGQCTNLKNPFWGASATKIGRYLPATAVGDPREFEIMDTRQNCTETGNCTGSNVGPGPIKSTHFFGVPAHECKCTSGCPPGIGRIPNARLVSSSFHDDKNVPDSNASHMLTQFGQFLDHDITLTPETEHRKCCHGDKSEDCLQINVPKDDPVYSNATPPVTCLDFTRSTQFCADNEEFEGAREQVNAITAFVDASNVYGSDEDASDELRTFKDGMLRVGNNELLPKDESQMRIAGDVRALEMSGLATVHTIFVREHNRIAKMIAKRLGKNPSDQLIFENARRILIAEMQEIVYQEFLPVVLGDKMIKEMGLTMDLSTRFKDKVDPSIINSFATAAFRFGHSMLQGKIEMASDNGTVVRTYQLGDAFFNISNYELDNGKGVDLLINGHIGQPAQKLNTHVTGEVTNRLFRHHASFFGSDLMSRNIQRGRDHGLPSYAAFAYYFDKNQTMDCWDQKPPQISQEKWDKLKTLYVHPHHIDLIVGGLSEDPVEGGLAGPLFTKIIGSQFKALKDGDRFFFTHTNQPKRFSGKARKEILGRSFAGIICDNSGVKQITRNVFLNPSESNPRVDCSSLKSFNLKRINLVKQKDIPEIPH